jgi:ORF6N domain
MLTWRRWRLNGNGDYCMKNLKSQNVTSSLAVPPERIERRILLIRGEKVMLSPDLTELYEVAPRALVQAVKRNRERFPGDFMFQLTRKEQANLKSQFVISSWGGARRAAPYAFTEQGVAMLSSVLRSTRAVQVNIAIMRAFVKLREMLASHRDLARRLDEMEQKYDAQVKGVFDAIRELMKPPSKPSRKIGFRSTRES